MGVFSTTGVIVGVVVSVSLSDLKTGEKFVYRFTVASPDSSRFLESRYGRPLRYMWRRRSHV